MCLRRYVMFVYIFYQKCFLAPLCSFFPMFLMVCQRPNAQNRMSHPFVMLLYSLEVIIHYHTNGDLTSNIADKARLWRNSTWWERPKEKLAVLAKSPPEYFLTTTTSFSLGLSYDVLFQQRLAITATWQLTCRSTSPFWKFSSRVQYCEMTQSYLSVISWSWSIP